VAKPHVEMPHIHHLDCQSV
jgi:hypothetical protein